MVELFGAEKKKDAFADLLAEFLLYQQIIRQIAKAQSLEKLGRTEESRRVIRVTDNTITNYLSGHPKERQAHLLRAFFYTKTGQLARAEAAIDGLLKSRDFTMTEDERLILSSELLTIQRQRPASQRPSSGSSGFTHVYCCQNCGRLHNFVSVPCPHCDWSPPDLEHIARSFVLSNAHCKIPDLLLFSRRITTGQPATDVVPNLIEAGTTILKDAEQRQGVEKVFSLLKENEHKNHRSINSARECPDCGQSVMISTAEKCEQCGSVLHWPDAIRLLVCMDNLLWLFEHRIEVSSSDYFSDFVSVLVSMTNNLLRKQESPPEHTRLYALSLLEKVGAICDLNKGAIINTKDPRKLLVYLVEESKRDDSQMFGLFLHSELEHFVGKMVHGVKG